MEERQSRIHSCRAQRVSGGASNQDDGQRQNEQEHYIQEEPTVDKPRYKDSVQPSSWSHPHNLLPISGDRILQRQLITAAAVRIALYIRNIGQELNITVPDTPTVQADATAALGFASNTGTTGRLKHIDLREEWVQELRSNSTIKVKVMK